MGKKLSEKERNCGHNSLIPIQNRSGIFWDFKTNTEVLRDQTHREPVYRPLQFDKRSQDFFGADDETLSVAMRVHNPDRSAFNVQS